MSRFVLLLKSTLEAPLSKRKTDGKPQYKQREENDANNGIGVAKRQVDFSLKDVLRYNDEAHLYDKILKLAVHVDDNPPIIFDWKFVHEFVEAIRDAYNQATSGGAAVPDPPQGLNIPDPSILTQRSSRKRFLLTPRWELPINMPSLYYCRLCVHPWTQHIIRVGDADNVLPNANVFIPKAGTDVLEIAIEPRAIDLWNSP
ncbi:High affinity nerve growth factor receptor precursor [Phytophthora palmivora]|uniref:High affinity nerve growth factor receptor n=1 Tax=Phytophthora palmivora TaxID=4796 RepID=A0A2P4XL35_9STRA|nr:High affinity nerve growth factor receptor precursor [Phytophthora palmivora]